MLREMLRARRADRYLRAQHALGRFSGSVLLARGSRVLLERGYGMADAAHKVPNGPATIFRIGSQTKVFTAIAILQLAEAGALDVADPIDRYLPGYPGGQQITIHHLLTNTSGIPDYLVAEDFAADQGRPHSLDALIARFRDRPPLFAPGEGFSYSNSGWVLLGAIVERVSGMPYAAYLRERILAPAGMQSSGIALGDEIVPHHAAGYAQTDHLGRATYIDNTTQHAAGGMHASAGDLHRFWQALMADRLVSPACREQLLSAHVQTEAGGYGYGLVVGERDGRRSLEASGGTFGFVSISRCYPAADLTVVVLANLEGAPFQELADDLAAIALGQPYELPSARRFVAADPSRFGDFVGRYELWFAGRRSALEVREVGGGLQVEVTGLRPAMLRALSATRFFASMKGEVELEFVGAPGSPAQEIALVWAGHALGAQRQEVGAGGSAR